MPKAVIYTRVSSVEQADGHSLDAQLKLLKDYAKQHNITIVKTVTVSESASGAQMRKHFGEMMTFLNKSKTITHLLCEKVDRITRNMKDAVTINDWLDKDKARQAHFVKQSLVIHKESSSNQILSWDIQMVMAKNTITNLKEEIKKGQKAALFKGMYPGTAKAGYISAGRRGDHSRGMPKKPDPIQAPKIRKIFELIASSMSVSDALAWAKEQNILNHTGKPISRAQLYVMLRDPFYCGMMRWNGTTYSGIHEPIIPKPIWQTVQDVIDGRRREKKRMQDYIYRGIMIDGETKKPMRVSTTKNIPYYSTSRRGEKYIPEQMIDDVVAKFLRMPKIKKSLMGSIQDGMRAFLDAERKNSREDRKVAMLRLQQIDGRMQKMEDLLLDGVISSQRYKERSAKMEKAREDVLINLKDDASAQNTANTTTLLELADMLQIAFKRYSLLSKTLKSDVAHLLLLELSVNEGKVCIKAKKSLEAVISMAESKSGVPGRI